MMIKGAKFWSDRERYYIQSNNAVELVLSRYGAKVSRVACGPTSMVNCLAALGYDVNSIPPGLWQPQPEDIATLFFHDPRNWDEFARIRPATDPAKTQYSPHEVPQYYPLAARQVFDANATFQWMNFDHVAAAAQAGNAVQICRKSPGHYQAAVAVDMDTNELILNDPNPKAGVGFNVRLTREDFQAGYNPFGIVYEGV